MARKTFSHEVKPFIQLRRCILRTLYESFKEYPYAPVELPSIAEQCRVDHKDLNWNIVYLERRGYVELTRAYDYTSFIAPSAAITPAGVDLIEDEMEFNRCLPKLDQGESGIMDDSLGESDPDCPFCSKHLKSKIVEDFNSVFAVHDRYPVTQGHLLVVTYRHTPNFFTMTPEERRDAENLLDVLQRKVLEEDNLVTGFNVGANCGGSAGQTITHAHIHLIPRRDGDIEEPMGGIRGAIPEKRIYGD